MDQLPDFWRTEVFHPLSVHFPIVLLLLATLFKFIGLWSSKVTWDHGGRLILDTWRDWGLDLHLHRQSGRWDRFQTIM